jgi:DTW domain-containing protein YfiP
MDSSVTASVTQHREQCFACFRPKTHCYCDLLPRVANQIPVLIVQHPRERFHPFNTARLLGLGLQQVRIEVDHSGRLRQPGSLRFREGAALLYPGPGARSLHELTADERPRELVMIDGTWHHAHTLLRDIPDLQRLPRVQIDSGAPSRYRIRREPREECLSSVEAAVHALQQMEPQTRGLSELLSAFERIIDRQIGFLKPGFNTRHPKRARPRELRKFPRALLDAEERLVVAYGDSVPSDCSGRASSRVLHWVAQRFQSNECFDCVISPPPALSPALLDKHRCHMGLSAEDLQRAVPRSEFVARWRGFLRPHDVAVVYNQSSLDLLVAEQVSPERHVVLKAMYFNLNRSFGSLDQIVRHEGLTPPASAVRGRASQRLGNALELVRFLRERLAWAVPTESVPAELEPLAR